MPSIRSLGTLSLLLGNVLAGTTCAGLAGLQGVADVEPWIVTDTATSPATAEIKYCNVTAVLGGRIHAWMQLPAVEAWNGRLVQIGCGGACGYNPFTNTYFDLAGALKNGSALSTTDMGVPTGDSNYDPMHNNYQMRIDWGYLATHLTAVLSKQVIETYYGKEPQYAYHLGSSTGGRQSLVEAQRYPEDFNGVFAIAPAYNETGRDDLFDHMECPAALTGDANLTAAITPAEAAVLAAAVLEDCDALDGIVDGIVSLPRLCKPNLDRLVCGSGSSPAKNSSNSCISNIALTAAKQIYQGPVSNQTGVKLVPEGLLLGSEDAWVGTYIATTPGTKSVWFSFAESFLSHYAFWPDPSEPATPLNVDLSDPTLLRRTSRMESLEFGGVADMTKFQQLGGKIIMTGGLRDVAVAPGFALDLWQRVGVAMGVEGPGSRESFFKFFEMPGVNHVSGGPGADQYDALGYLIDWVEAGKSPDVLVASHLHDNGNGTVAFTRPLYEYPMVAGYSGKGDASSWKSYEPVNGSAGTD